VRAEAECLIGGRRDPIDLYLKEDRGMLKVYLARFQSPLLPGESFEIRYQELWPRAMALGFDAVFYTQTLYYAKGVESMTSRVDFDGAVRSAAAHRYHLSSGALVLDDRQPVRVGDSHVYDWTRPAPLEGWLYFLLFQRAFPGGQDLLAAKAG